MSALLESLQGKKLLLVASTGGHLSQLDRLAQRFQPSSDSLWVTFEKPQSRSLMQGKRHIFIPYIAPRDLTAVVRGMMSFRSMLKDEKFDAVVSTGAGIALSSHFISTRRGLRTVYIESVSRIDGPSVTGRILQRFGAVERYSQNDGYDSNKWKQEFSVLDTYEADATWVAPHFPKKIFVSLGTIHPYKFDSLIEKLIDVAPRDTEFVWQLGSSYREGLPGRAVAEMSSTEFHEALTDSDLVITHSGVGNIMYLLDERRPILVVPRRKFRNEHVDDHQLQIGREVNSRGLAVTQEVDALTRDSLVRAAGIRVK